MILRADIEAAKDKIFGVFTVGAMREIKKLEEFLHNGETVSYICPGEYSDARGILAVTSERVIFLRDSIISKTNQDFPFRHITSVEWVMRIMYGDVVLFSSSFKEVRIAKVPRNNGLEVTKLIREGIRNGSLPLFDFTATQTTTNVVAEVTPSTPQNAPTTLTAAPEATSGLVITPTQSAEPIPATIENKSSLLADLEARYERGEIEHTVFFKEKARIRKLSD